MIEWKDNHRCSRSQRFSQETKNDILMVLGFSHFRCHNWSLALDFHVSFWINLMLFILDHRLNSFSFADLSASGWCALAYWELNERVGSLVPVEESAFDVFSEQTRGAGLCIRTLAQQRATRTPDKVLKTREKIGLGEFINIPSQSYSD